MNRIKGLVSAVMPTFNRASRILDRVQELENQTYPHWELIIVNDCSTDNTQEVLKQLENHPKVKIVHLKENSGCCSIPRAIGICKAVGEFIAPIDDDCISLPYKFQFLVEALNENPKAVIAYGDRVNVSTSGFQQIIIIPNWNPKERWGVDNSQFIYRANVYDTLPIIFPTRACDWHTAKHICELGEIVYVNCVVSHYLWHETNRSHHVGRFTTEPEKFKPYLDLENFKFNFCTDNLH